MWDTAPDTRAGLGVGRLDLRPPPVSVEEIGTTIEAVATDLQRLWTYALERGDFHEITRLVEASHAVHLAAIALDGARVIGGRPASSLIGAG